MTLNVHPTRVEGDAPGGLGPAPGVRYLPIAEHGLIGDLHTVARRHRRDDRLVLLSALRLPEHLRGYPRRRTRGLFRITPDSDWWSSKPLYLPDTNVLITRFLMPEGVGEVQDFMPPPGSGESAHRQ